MHYNGYAPGGKNVQLAISEFRQAAEAKDPNAGTALGMIYHKVHCPLFCHQHPDGGAGG